MECIQSIRVNTYEKKTEEFLSKQDNMSYTKRPYGVRCSNIRYNMAVLFILTNVLKLQERQHKHYFHTVDK